MVLVHLMGGLGNQLFQYAAARGVAHRNNVPLKLDTLGLRDYRLRSYRLMHFRTEQHFATQREVSSFTGKGRNSLVSGVTRLIDGRHPYYLRRVVKERHAHFDANILKVRGNAYLQGFWQSEKYFKDIETVIRSEFAFRSPPSPKNQEFARRLAEVNSVSIHFRRGDYVTDKTVKQILNTCPMRYYHDAIHVITERVKFPHFFVFSDDPEWVQTNLTLRQPTTFVSHNKADADYEDLRLMTMCKHHVIANSTFGWWGAWLASNPNKIVIAPRKWFNSSELDAKDLIPEGWTKI